MAKKHKETGFFKILDSAKACMKQYSTPESVADLLNNLYSARKTMEYEILTSAYFYKLLLGWTDQLNKKQITIKDLLSRGTYTKSELKSKLGLFLLNLKAFKKYLERPNAFAKDDLYNSLVKFSFNKIKLNKFKKLILNKKIKTNNIFYNNIIKQQVIIDTCISDLIKLYAPLAIDLAQKRGLQYSDNGKILADYQDDLMQIGLLGILNAAEHWEPNKNAAFSTYAWYWIENEFTKFFNTRDIVLLPKNLIDLRNKINRISLKYGIKKSNVSDFRKYFKDSDKRIEAAMANEGCISINELMAEETDIDDDGINLITDKQDIIQDIANVTNAEILNSIIDKRLHGKEKKILNMRFGLGGERQHLMAEIADELNITQEWVRHNLKNSIIKIIPEVVSVFGEEYEQQDTGKVLKMHRKAK